VRYLYLAILASFLAPVSSSAETVYKYTDRSGNVVYSATPPVSGGPVSGDGVQQIPLPAAPDSASVADAKAREQRLLDAAQEVDRAQQQRDEQAVRRDEALARAHNEVAAAEQALAQARVRKGTDYRNISRRDRLKKSYFERVREHEALVEQARQHLQEVEAEVR